MGSNSEKIFSISQKKYVVSTHLKHLSKAFLMSTHNMFFYGERLNEYPQYMFL